MKKIGFLQDANGNFSNSRLIADIVIIAALIFAEQVILLRGDTAIIVAAAAAGSIFLTIAGSAMLFLFSQKKEEGKQDELKQNLTAKVENPDNAMLSNTPTT
jgi:hypothetical protein